MPINLSAVDGENLKKLLNAEKKQSASTQPAFSIQEVPGENNRVVLERTDVDGKKNTGTGLRNNFAKVKDTRGLLIYAAARGPFLETQNILSGEALWIPKAPLRSHISGFPTAEPWAHLLPEQHCKALFVSCEAFIA